jgi:hypothetical protein
MQITKEAVSREEAAEEQHLGRDESLDAEFRGVALVREVDELLFEDVLRHRPIPALRGSAPAARANPSRSGTVSIASTRLAPSRKQLRIAICPTGPQPQTAIVSPG